MPLALWRSCSCGATRLQNEGKGLADLAFNKRNWALKGAHPKTEEGLNVNRIQASDAEIGACCWAPGTGAAAACCKSPAARAVPSVCVCVFAFFLFFQPLFFPLGAGCAYLARAHRPGSGLFILGTPPSCAPTRHVFQVAPGSTGLGRTNRKHKRGATQTRSTNTKTDNA